MSDIDIGQQRGIGADLVYRLRTELGEAPESITAMPDDALRRAILKLEHPDRARRRIEHDLGPLQGDDGDVDDGALVRALLQAAVLRDREPPGLTGGLPTGNRRLPADAGLTGVAGLVPAAGWTALGPGNIGGRTRSIVIDPTDTRRIFAGGIGGGVWRSTNAGASWSPTDDLMGNLAICSLVAHPTDPDTLYAGTGEGFGNVDAIRGDGIFTTTDGGVTWAQLPSTASNADFRYVNALAISPDGAALLAGTRAGLFLSTDAGVSWTQTSTVSAGNVAFDPNDGGRAIAGASTGGQALFSTDGGQTWTFATRPTAPTGRVQVCHAVADPSITYASVDASPSQIWRSTDGGQTYTSRAAQSGGAAASFLGQQGWYDNVIWAGDPTDADVLLVGGIDLWRSTDGGDTLLQISTWWSSGSAHADHHAIVADPGYDGVRNRRVYFGNDGGIYRANDVLTVGNNAAPPYTNGWVNLNHGYAVTQFYYGAGHVGTSTIIGGAQDNGTLRYTPATATTWNKVYGGDGGDCASDPTDPQIYYGEYVYLDIFRNTDGGATDAASSYISGHYWTGTQWAWKAAPYVITDARDANAAFIAPFELDPNDHDRLLGGGLSLWRTTDPRTPNTTTTGPTWATIKAPIGSTRAHQITAIAIADGDSDIVVIGHGNGDVYRTTDATAVAPTWQRIDTNGIGADRQCLGLAIDPDDHDVVYVTFGGYAVDNVWKTTDGGQTWAGIGGGLPDAPVRDVTLHPQRSHWVYLATEVGIFGSEDGGATWSPTNEGPADVACNDLFWLGTTLAAVTHGRGMFTIDLTIANAFPAPQLAFVGTEDYVANGLEFTRYRLEVTNAADYPGSLFRPSPDLPPCGLNRSAARTWVDIHDGTTDQRIYGFCALGSGDDLQRIWFGLPRGAAPPASVYVVLRDRRSGQTYTSNADAVGASPAGPEARRITNVDQVEGAIVRLGGPWGTASVEDVIASIDAGTATYHVEAGGVRARVSAVSGRSRRYLRSSGDRDTGNNLDSLPPIR